MNRYLLANAIIIIVSSWFVSVCFFFFSSRRRHTRFDCDWSSDVCSSDLLSAPRVTTKPGQRAVIEIIREFRYPTEFDPPQIPQNFGNSGGGSTVTILIQIGRASCRERV